MSFLKSSEAEPVAEAPSGKSREVGIWNWVSPRPGTCDGAMTWTLAQSPRGSDQWKRFGTSGVWLQVKIYRKVRLRQSYHDLCPVPPPSPCATSVCLHFLQLSLLTATVICCSRTPQTHSCLRVLVLPFSLPEIFFRDICMIFPSSLGPLLQSHLLSQASPGCNHTMHTPTLLSPDFIFLLCIYP